MQAELRGDNAQAQQPQKEPPPKFEAGPLYSRG